MDGIDAVAVRFDGRSTDLRAELLAGRTLAYPEGLRADLDALRADPDAFPAARLAALDAAVGDAFANAAEALVAESGLARSAIRAIGSHGQTVLHRPDADRPHTVQVGDPSRIAAALGVDVIADLRRADVAAGGQGAPLAPLLHRALLHRPGERRAVVNLGGIANVTRLDADGAVSGFDTGPASCFLDDWYRAHHPCGARFDEGGAWASGGRVDEALLARLLDDPYFHRTPPKSTGIEYFSPAWLRARLPADAERRPADIQATLAEFSAASLAAALAEIAPERILVCGGGVHNPDLIGRVRQRLASDVELESTTRHGLNADFVEATLVAWLAREFVEGRPVDTPPITGAGRPVRLGALYPG
ncbi:anhydro-N-acetylmuramic acid kinase [Halomonas denitrificans]|nr:anhydro-N-acetylmuramic acid kinase [Halomonas denitrificans]